jgi:ribonuclease T2
MAAKLARALLVAGVCGVLLTPSGSGQAKKKRVRIAADFDYYLLVLSWAPSFCAQPEGHKDPRECGSGRRIGFVVHGMWPQGETTRGPENCGPAGPVAANVVQLMLMYIPTESLVQHEWTSHGSCTGLSALDYFGAVRKARDLVRIPLQFENPSSRLSLTPGDIESAFAAYNPTFPKDAFRVSCYRDNMLQEVRVCLNRDLTPRPCGASVGECRSPSVTVFAPQ